MPYTRTNVRRKFDVSLKPQAHAMLLTERSVVESSLAARAMRRSSISSLGVWPLADFSLRNSWARLTANSLATWSIEKF